MYCVVFFYMSLLFRHLVALSARYRPYAYSFQTRRVCARRLILAVAHARRPEKKNNAAPWPVGLRLRVFFSAAPHMRPCAKANIRVSRQARLCFEYAYCFLRARIVSFARTYGASQPARANITICARPRIYMSGARTYISGRRRGAGHN